jgi:hypothetical protein
MRSIFDLRQFRNRERSIDLNVLPRALGHRWGFGRRRVLHECDAALILDCPEAGSPVIEHPGEDHPDEAWSIGDGG